MSAEPTLEELEALFSAPAAPNARITLEVDDEKYGLALVLPAGFPTIAPDEEAAVRTMALKLSQLVYNSFVQHYLGDETSD